MSRGWLVQRLATTLPRKIAEAPERVLINVAVAIIGLAALTTESPGSLLAVWPDGFDVTWALAMTLGGGFAVVGYWNNLRHRWANSLERLGYLLILLASVVYGVGVIVAFGWQGLAAGVLYLMIAFAKLVRLLVTSAYRNYVLNGGRRGGHS